MKLLTISFKFKDDEIMGILYVIKSEFGSDIVSYEIEELKE